MIKVVLVSSSDSAGGAAKASYRFFSAFKVCSKKLNVSLVVSKKSKADSSIITDSSFWIRLCSFIRYVVGRKLISLQKTSNKNYHSGNWLPGHLPKLIKEQRPDIVNFHWINDESISIEQIGKKQLYPIVLTLHDMWAFCGSEHYVNSIESSRYVNGYKKNDSLCGNSGIDIDRIVWKRKLKAWGGKRLTIVTPSQWLTECAKQSQIFNSANVRFKTIANTLDTNLYKPLIKKPFRDLLGIPDNKVVIGFGALSAQQDTRKGYDLLKKALVKLSELLAENRAPGDQDIVFLIFGAEGVGKNIAGFKTYSTGHLNDEVAIASAYNAMDIMLVPSRLEAFGQTASEAQSCGVPVVCFDSSGLKDVVKHKSTGYLAECYNVSDFAEGILWCLSNKFELSKMARERALACWSYAVINTQYEELYTEILNNDYGNE
ncbi:glycosyltransferase [Pseudoalteromonas sp. BSi20429]|uniref:glycosyltransferase n=1 Tax=Pseudoalteromonas sp. BSi20429 TaxID=1097676 RepID=UPI00023177DD|nr:glycosyltransferase [Pseudoalteromonas sp. BSi20429]GAA68729.1 hypothetical protein P20429_2856 [Pseudoalteromonas sp. BSi20429]